MNERHIEYFFLFKSILFTVINASQHLQSNSNVWPHYEKKIYKSKTFDSIIFISFCHMMHQFEQKSELLIFMNFNKKILTQIWSFTLLSCLKTVLTLKSMPTVDTKADVKESSAYLKIIFYNSSEVIFLF